MLFETLSPSRESENFFADGFLLVLTITPRKVLRVFQLPSLKNQSLDVCIKSCGFYMCFDYVLSSFSSCLQQPFVNEAHTQRTSRRFTETVIKGLLILCNVDIPLLAFWSTFLAGRWTWA